MLSTESPISPSRSTILSGGTPNLFLTHASSHHSTGGTGTLRLTFCEFCRIAMMCGIPDELAQVLVVRDDHGLHSFCRDLLGKRADDVVGLKTVHLHDRNAKCLADALDVWHLRRQDRPASLRDWPCRRQTNRAEMSVPIVSKTAAM